MVVEGVASASTTTMQALLLCALVGWNQGSTFLVTKTVALSPSFAYFLCLTCPVLFLISAIALTLRLLSSTGTLPLGSTRRARSCWEDVKLARLARALCLVPEYVPAARWTWLHASVELDQLGARDAAFEGPPSQQ
ncbi:hypothetical protein PI125_g21226 [Phytophthora idaei]|nr:hypothetical protein PI125_g21226 [Phytophthora idaei]KAG3132191.1 hypothetical protein PI126_g19745 [Phytophthora idaei]